MKDNMRVLDQLIADALRRQDAASKDSKPAVADEDGDAAEDAGSCSCGCPLVCKDCGKEQQSCDC